MSKCPRCKKSPLNGTELICDNDCGTVFCEFCQFEWHNDPKIMKFVSGHAPWCGSESDSDYVESNDSESEEYDESSDENSDESSDDNSDESGENRRDQVDSDENSE